MEPVSKPETLGYSSAKLDVLRAWMKTQHTTALMVSVGGHVLFEYGDVKLVSVVASVRKSTLAMMYGKYIANGTIDPDKTRGWRMQWQPWDEWRQVDAR